MYKEGRKEGIQARGMKKKEMGVAMEGSCVRKGNKKEKSKAMKEGRCVLHTQIINVHGQCFINIPSYF